MERAAVVPCAGYDIVVGSGVLADVPSDLLRKVCASRYVIVSDTNVNALYGEALRIAFEDALPSDAQAVRTDVGMGREVRRRRMQR